MPATSPPRTSRLRLPKGLLILFAGSILALAQSRLPGETSPPSDLAVAPQPPAGQSNDPAPTVAEQPAAQKPLDSTPALPAEIKPEVFYFKDKDGQLKAVPGLSFERLLELIRLQGGVGRPDEKPKGSVQQTRIAGRASGDRAELRIELSIALTQAGWTRVPLGLDGAVLQSYEGEGEPILRLDEAVEGYSVWLRAKSEQETRKLTLNVLVPLMAANGQTRLELDLPSAATATLALTVPVDRATASVSEGSLVESTRSTRPGETELHVTGASGQFELTWRAGDGRATAAAPLLESNVLQLVTIDSRNVNTEARLTVRSVGGPFDQFQVRLPPGAELSASSGGGATVVSLDAVAGQPRVLQVKLPGKTLGPVELRLTTDRPRPSIVGETMELGGFEVLDAARQWGFVAARVVGNWQVRWEPLQNVRQIDQPPDALRRDDLSASFEYNAQPFSLRAQPTPRTMRIGVSPEYVCLVGADQIQLTARLRYLVRGAKVAALHVDLAGWDLDELAPANVVNVEAIEEEPAAAVTVPLVQPASGEFEITLRAHRPTPSGGKLDFGLPRPDATSIGPAALVILAADNVELSPESGATSGLAPQPARPALKLPERQQEPLLFRADVARARFVAAVKVQPQSVAVEAASQVDVDDREIRVRQHLTYQVLYEPLDRLALDVPAALAVEQMQASIDGQKVAVVPLREPAGGDRAAGRAFRVVLPAPKIGRFELQLAYTRPHDRPVEGASPVSVPLVMPRGAALAKNRAYVSVKSGLQAAVAGGPWTIDSQRRLASLEPATIVAAAAGPARQIDLTLAVADRQAEGATQLDRAWVQSWLTDSIRQDRVAFRFTSTDRRVRVALPTDASADAVEVVLDGVRVAAAQQRGLELAVPLPVAGASRTHVLELRYRFERRPAPGRMTLEPPQFKSSAWVGQCYWELVAPPSEHLLLAPASWVGEFDWRFSMFGWRRHPRREQTELESWAGVTSSVLAAAGGNRYLFSSAGKLEPLDLRTSGRGWLVSVASLGCLAVGLLLIHVPAVRHPAILLAPAVVLTALATLDPEATVLLAQSGAIGMALAAVAWLLARRTPRRPSAPATIRGSSISRVDRAGAEIQQRAARSSGLTSTAATPMAAQGSSQELKP